MKMFPAVVCFVLLWISPMLAQKLERGVSLELATQRAQRISNVEYDLSFQLSESDPIVASVDIRFDLSDTDSDVVLDFNSPTAKMMRTRFGVKKGHVVIPAGLLKVGKNDFSIPFTAGDQSLNRNGDFLYTLLVPDRASTVFPCFDQPDLKAKFKLTLELPQGWTACTNGALEKQNGNVLTFEQTKPISTYLFAFAAGKFETITREISGRSVTMYHRESDPEKVERNLKQIFKMHEISLDWMEEYTEIPYPFKKFDFVVIPSFQYGGMEHNGSIFYNADQMFLDVSATQKQKLRRASLIAHETAHMWFGNLVTMKWFDDVWLKEVFANFMAAKIVHPGFTDLNHDLGFMVRHHPAAYSEDRSGGTYPIQQKLDNLRNAGTLYGRIIYEKAPIVMRQLESMVGQKEMRSGLREYLREFSYGNAVWDDLVDILDRESELDLKQWSNAWVKEAGTPEIESNIDDDAGQRSVTIRQTKKTPTGKFWSQQVDLKFLKDGEIVHQDRVMIEGESTKVSLPESARDYDCYLANGSELGYGYFRLDEQSRVWLLGHAHEISDEVTRGAAWLTLYESMIRSLGGQEVPPMKFAAALVVGLQQEKEPLNRQNLLDQFKVTFWKLLSPEQRKQVAVDAEAALWKWIDDDSAAEEARLACYKTLVVIASTDAATDRLYEIWESESKVGGIELSESDQMTLAYELAVRLPEKADGILKAQLGRLGNEDRKKKFAFVMPSLSADSVKRDAFFESLKTPSNRRPERWALDGLHYLHHPLRATGSEKYILPSLELLEEIQTTGDIFFPKRWLVETLSSHRSASAAAVVTDFLKSRPDYSVKLKRKIFQAADLLLKISKANGEPENQQEPAIKGQWSEPVGGIRMMVKYLQPDAPADEIQLLVFTQNVSAKPLELPALISESRVVFKNSKLIRRSSGNLRITVDPLGDQKVREIRELQDFEMDRQGNTLEPGEILLHAIRLESPMELQKAMQAQSVNAIRTDSVCWPALTDPNSKGRWKISLSWRPDRKFPVDEDAEQFAVKNVAEQWRDVQIDLPPLELDWDPASDEVQNQNL